MKIEFIPLGIFLSTKMAPFLYSGPEIWIKFSNES